jgi:hypothetical protein
MDDIFSMPHHQCCGSGMFISDPGSDFFPSRIPDPNCFHPGSRIRIKEFKYFNPKKWFLSSRKYDPGCSSRLQILTFYPSRIPDPGVKKAPDPGSRIRIRNTAHHCSSGKGHPRSPDMRIDPWGGIFKLLRNPGIDSRNQVSAYKLDTAYQY